jgi:hypothetical protein
LRGCKDRVELPVVKADLLGANTADTVHNEQSVRADAVHEIAQCLELAEYAGRGIHVCDGNHLVLLVLERLLDLVELRPVTNWRLELCHLDAVRLEAVGEGIRKVAGVQDEDLIAGLDQVGGDLIPSEGAGAGDDNGLRGRVGGLEELAQVLEDLAEAVYKGLADM